TITAPNTINFNGTGSAMIGGTSTTNFGNVTLNKGTDTTSVVEIVSQMNMSGQLTLTKGMLKVTHNLATVQFNTNPTTIASTAGLWINGGTLLTGTTLSVTNNGLIRVGAGSATFGNVADNALSLN